MANTLTFLGYQPIWQDIFGTEGGDLRAMLRQQIDQCKGVVQLIGQSYGAEPPAPDEEFGRVSYTQYEALYARKSGKKIWYLFIDETFPIDEYKTEPKELQELQTAYRQRLQSDTHLYHPLTSSEGLEAGVLKLRDDLTRLRRGVKQWATGVAALLVLITGLVVWMMRAQHRQTGLIQEQATQVNAVIDRYQKMQQALVRLADVETQTKQPGAKLTPEEQRASAYAILEKELGLEAGTLSKELPGFALGLYSRSDTTPLLRARAAYALGKFDEAQKLSVEGAEQDVKAYETAKKVQQDRRKSAIESYKLAGQSAQKLIKYNEAMSHLHEAEKLTDREHEPLEWADVEDAIADLLIDQGQHKNAEDVLRTVVQTRTQRAGPEDPATLKSRSHLNYARWKQGKLSEAEADFRELIKLQEKVLGREHRDTLSSRNGLAGVLEEQGKYREAEAEYRLLLELKEKALGSEDRDTLVSRLNLALAVANQGRFPESEALYREGIKLCEKFLGPEDRKTLWGDVGLGGVLNAEGKYAEAEAQYRKLIEVYERLLGPEHLDTLNTRYLLADTLASAGKLAQAEAECRDVIKLQEKVLGHEHSETLRTRAELAIALNKQGKYPEAEGLCRDVIKLEEKLLGPETVDALTSRELLATALYGQGKDAEAEAQFRDILRLGEKVLGPDNPIIFECYYDFASGLRRQGKLPEAKAFAQRAVDGAHKVLGLTADAKRYEKLLAELEAKK